MTNASIQLTIVLFHFETCAGFLVAVASIAFLLVGFIRTRLWGFLLLAISSGGFLFQLVFRYVAFLSAYGLPPALKIAATAVYSLSSAVSLIGTIALAFGAQKALKAAHFPALPTI